MTTFSIKRALRRLSSRANPEPAFVLKLEKTLRERGYLPWQKISRFRVLWKTSTIALSVVLSMAAGTASYAYVSEDVIPGHPLYALRSTIEQWETQLAKTKGAEQQQKVSLKHLERRVREAHKLLPMDDASLPAAYIESFQNDINVVVAPPRVVTEKVISHEETYLPRLLNIEKKELSEMVDQQKDSESKEEKKIMNKMILDEVDQIHQQVKNLHKNDRAQDPHGEEDDLDSDE